MGNIVFNETICIMGILIFLIHIINIAIKKKKRKDEKALFVFILFTIIHFSIYLMYTIIHLNYTSNPFILSFYTTFYIMNNVEAFLFFIYMLCYIELDKGIKYKLQFISTALFVLFNILNIINIFTGIFFTVDNGIYIRSKFMLLSQGYQFIILVIIFFVTLFNKKSNIREKMAFSSYSILPLIAIILQNIFRGYAIAYAAIIISVEVLFFFVNVEKNMIIAYEEKKNKEAQINIMLSQIQPHFIYNSLSSISTLIEIEPLKAQKALDDFTEYLRMNLSSLTNDTLIPFEYELKHIKTYIELEKIRFNDRINVIFDIKVKDFNVSPLTIQPIVENAIKHGILKKIEGGTVIIKTSEDINNYYIEVIDDGVGFDINEVNFYDNHYGLNNLKYRINNTNGKIDIKSELNKGTDVLVTLMKG